MRDTQRDTRIEQIHSFVSTVREMTRHEDGLMNHRLTWMWTLQGLLFGAAAFMWNKDVRVVVSIAIVGLLSCVSIGYCLARGLQALHDLRALDKGQRKKLPADSVLPPAVGAQRGPLAWWLLPGSFLPWLFGIGWIVMLEARFIHSGWVP